ncbi:hypothetical protein BLA29_011339, partial [Euroglyphus maynei]
MIHFQHQLSETMEHYHNKLQVQVLQFQHLKFQEIFHNHHLVRFHQNRQLKIDVVIRFCIQNYRKYTASLAQF